MNDAELVDAIRRKDPAVFEAALQRLRDRGGFGRPLCSACGKDPQTHEGFCQPCYLAKAIEAYREETRLRERVAAAKRLHAAERQRRHRSDTKPPECEACERAKCAAHTERRRRLWRRREPSQDTALFSL